MLITIVLLTSTVVGYANGGLKWGVSLKSAQFLDVAGGNLSLDNFVATGDDVGDNVTIDTFDEYGRTLDTYLWNEWAAETPCWVNDSYEPITGVSFLPGEGISVTGSNGDQAIQTSGQVGTADIAVALKWGVTLCGNPFPVKVALQDIVASGDDVGDNVTIDTFDEYGRTLDTYLWNEWAAEEPCWVNDSYEPVEGVEFAAGEGVSITGSAVGQYVTFPAPEL